MHPSLIEKPALTVADLHLIGKFLNFYGENPAFTDAEDCRVDELYEALDDYLVVTVGPDWDTKEALVG